VQVDRSAATGQVLATNGSWPPNCIIHCVGQSKRRTLRKNDVQVGE